MRVTVFVINLIWIWIERIEIVSLKPCTYYLCVCFIAFKNRLFYIFILFFLSNRRFCAEILKMEAEVVVFRFLLYMCIYSHSDFKFDILSFCHLNQPLSPFYLFWKSSFLQKKNHLLNATPYDVILKARVLCFTIISCFNSHVKK